MRGYSKPMLWKASALAILFLFQGGQAGVVPVVEEDLGGYLKLVKRVNDNGRPVVHLDLHERWHEDEIGQILKKRQNQAVYNDETAVMLLPEPSQEEKDLFGQSFDTSCVRQNNQIATVEELSGVALSVLSTSGSYEIDGWSNPGMIALGNTISDPKKYQSEVPIHCLGGAGKTSIVLGPEKPDSEFKYGVSFSRALVARLLNTMIYRCQYNTRNAVVPFSLSPKAKHLEFVQIQTAEKNCEDWVNPLCKSTDDESKAECLVAKNVLGIPWSQTKPTPTKPSKAKK
ncbi:hypothetical protein TWF730_004500 [Orbilia blumenaviensis]|uniref:Uncharacterized protein n=1 Tax=Orbilia blumenaviensis TaxID=1796055 RepID=A0AAV9U043_9PEZI